VLSARAGTRRHLVRVSSRLVNPGTHTQGAIFDEAETPAGAASLQLAFRVAPAEVDECAAVLRSAGVAILRPPADQPWGHRTLFFRDPDGNIVEIYADI
jgi:catechol 2,3-dioxygenase-like lactoylglutathione lyase family enzyme